MSMDAETIILEAALDAPPRAVWRALTEPQLLARWLGASDIEAAVGRRFTVIPGGAAGPAPVACEVIEVEPDRLLSYRWRTNGEGRAALDTVVTWVLDPTPDGGTRLRLVHDGFPVTLQRPAATFGTMAASSTAARPREGGDPGVFDFESVRCRKNLDPRLRGDERIRMQNRRTLAWAA
jgi:uncharacterized protein YndB with AHSA1/START domain